MDDSVSLLRVDFRKSVVDQDGCTMRGSTGTHVAPSVADYKGTAKIEGPFFCRLLQHARLRLATLTPIGIHMKAHLYAVDWQIALNHVVKCINDTARQQAFCDVWLIRNHDHLESRSFQFLDTVVNTGHQLPFCDCDGRVSPAIAESGSIDDSVSIKKDSSAQLNGFHLGFPTSSAEPSAQDATQGSATGPLEMLLCVE
jgi:hypothetical protein